MKYHVLPFQHELILEIGVTGCLFPSWLLVTTSLKMDIAKAVLMSNIRSVICYGEPILFCPFLESDLRQTTSMAVSTSLGESGLTDEDCAQEPTQGTAMLCFFPLVILYLQGLNSCRKVGGGH